MRTTIDLDATLVADAQRLGGLRTKREPVDAALREFVASRRQQDIRALDGRSLTARDADVRAARRRLDERRWSSSTRPSGTTCCAAATRRRRQGCARCRRWVSRGWHRSWCRTSFKARRARRACRPLREPFMALPTVTPSATTHADAGAFHACARWQGITPRRPHDCLIAQLAVEHGRPLLHGDPDFEALQRVEPRLELLRA